MAPRVAIIADWLTSRGGAEKVILQILQCFPNAELFTSVYKPENFPELQNTKVHTSFINKLPFAKNKHPLFIQLMPLAFESFDLSNYDIVISSSVACSKGVITKPSTLHICYCHTPMRFAWDGSHQYIKEFPLPNFLKKFVHKAIHKIRIWDKSASSRVDTYIANSKHVQKRIKKYYKRDSTVIYPGINITNTRSNNAKKNYYLSVGRLIAYKKFDLTVKAFNKTKKNLIIIGKGRMLEQLKKLNTNPNTKFLGYVTKQELEQYMSEAKALIFPQEEDFGIVPLEAQLHQTPVIAFNKGGATETVIAQKTGVFFNQQTPNSLNQAIQKFEELQLSGKEIQENAKNFSNQRFRKELKEFVQTNYEQHQKNYG